MSDKNLYNKSSEPKDKNFSQPDNIDFPEQKLNQILEKLPSFISKNKQAYLVGETEYEDYSEKIETINKEEEFNDFLHYSLNKKYHYESLSSKEQANSNNVNILEKYRNDLAHELKNLKQEYNLSKKERAKLEKRYHDLGPIPNKDQYGRQIFKTHKSDNFATNIDQELDQELDTLGQTMNISLKELHKKQAKVKEVEKNIEKQKRMQNTYRTPNNYQQAQQVSANEMKILEAKITLAKIEAQKAEAEAAKAKAEAEKEYYKTQSIKLDQKNKKSWWKFWKKN